MNEHDDDLDSEVVEGSEEEVDDFPNTGDDLDEGESDPPDDEGENTPLDKDPAELRGRERRRGATPLDHVTAHLR